MEKMSKIPFRRCFPSLIEPSSTHCPQTGRSSLAGRGGARDATAVVFVGKAFPKCATSVNWSTSASSLYERTCKRELLPHYSSQGILSFWSTKEFIRDGSRLPTCLSHGGCVWGGADWLCLQTSTILEYWQLPSMSVYWLIEWYNERYSSKCKSATTQEVPCYKTCCCCSWQRRLTEKAFPFVFPIRERSRRSISQ